MKEMASRDNDKGLGDQQSLGQRRMGHTQAPVPENTQYLKYKKNWACITAGLAFN